MNPALTKEGGAGCVHGGHCIKYAFPNDFTHSWLFRQPFALLVSPSPSVSLPLLLFFLLSLARRVQLKILPSFCAIHWVGELALEEGIGRLFLPPHHYNTVLQLLAKQPLRLVLFEKGLDACDLDAVDPITTTVDHFQPTMVKVVLKEYFQAGDNTVVSIEQLVSQLPSVLLDFLCLWPSSTRSPSRY